jgi:signal transduction histidine kinase/ligand-binding sensor domain-containing protein
VVTTLSWDKLPEQAFDTAGFKPFAYPVEETKFDPGALPEKDLDIDKLPSHPLKFKTYILPPPKLVKGAKPQIKNGNLYLFGFGEDQKTPEIVITSLLYDRDGFLWITSEQGLYRFDGENLLLFLSYPENGYGMLQDTLGNIWLANTFGTTQVLDFKGGVLKKSIAGQGIDSLHRMMLDQQQRIWATSETGVVKIIDTKTQTVKILDKAHGLSTSNRTVGMMEDKSGNIWISQGGGGLNILDLKNKKIKHLDQAHGLSSDRVNNVFRDSTGRLWAGIYGGLINVIDVQKNSIQTISEAQSPAPRMNVISLTQDDKGRIWIGTGANGVTIIDPAKRGVIHLKKNNGLIANDVYDIKHDSRGQTWIGTGSGLNMISDDRYLAENIGKDTTTNLIEDGHGLIWQATSQGVNILNLKKRTSRHLGIKQGLANEFVHFIRQAGERFFISTDSSLEILDTAGKTITHLKSSYSNILFDKTSRVWYLDGTERGINLYDPKNKTIKHFGKDELQLDDYIYFMCLDGQGRIWLSDSYGEVEVVDPDAGTVQFLTNIKRRKRYSSVHFLPDNKGNVWMGTNNGIYVADLKNQTITNFSTAQGLLDNKVWSLLQYKGNIYARTNQGVTVITPPAGGVSAKRKWQAVSHGMYEKQPVSHNADLMTRDGIYWSGGLGLTAMDPGEKDTFQPVPYITGISVYDHPMYFFDKTRFNPSAIDTLWRQKGETSFLKDETPANTSSAFRSGLQWDDVTGPSNLPVNLQIPFNQNFIHFHYCTLNLTPHDTTRYRYILSGVDKNWSDITSDTSTVNYMNLQPGNYTFEVISRGSDNVWSKPANFSFTVNPPWWQTVWAYILYIVLFIGAALSFTWYRSRKLIREKRVLEHKVHERTEEVLQQKEEIAAQRDNLEVQKDNLEKTLAELKTAQTQLIQSEKMASLGELTAGIAHEIQNPLNFVNNFSEVNQEMISELEAELTSGNISEALVIATDIKQNEQKINHHGKRADAIVKGMLQHSKTARGTKEPTNINALADEYLRLAYHGLRSKDKNLNAELVTNFGGDLPLISVVPQDIGRVLLNLFNNAFYAVNQKKKDAGDNYEPRVSVTTFSNNGDMVIKVKDNGVGIPDAIKDKIMQPFFTTKPTGEGTGLGLSLTYDMVVKGHGGTIIVESEDGKGSEFIVKLPIQV